MRKLWIVPGLLILVLIGAPVWKPAAKKWRWFVIATNIFQDTLRRSGLVSGQIGNTADGAGRDLSELPRVRQIYGDYLRYSGCSKGDLERLAS